MRREEFIGQLVARVSSWENVWLVVVDCQPQSLDMSFFLGICDKSNWRWNQPFFVDEVEQATSLTDSFSLTQAHVHWLRHLKEQKENREKIFNA